MPTATVDVFADRFVEVVGADVSAEIENRHVAPVALVWADALPDVGTVGQYLAGGARRSARPGTGAVYAILKASEPNAFGTLVVVT